MIRGVKIVGGDMVGDICTIIILMSFMVMIHILLSPFKKPQSRVGVKSKAKTSRPPAPSPQGLPLVKRATKPPAMQLPLEVADLLDEIGYKIDEVLWRGSRPGAIWVGRYQFRELHRYQHLYYVQGLPFIWGLPVKLYKKDCVYITELED